jgi:hypothetical protein
MVAGVGEIVPVLLRELIVSLEKTSLTPVGAAVLDPKRWYDQRRSGSRAGVWQTRRLIESQSRVETLKTHCHGHRGDDDGSAGIRTAVDHL